MKDRPVSDDVALDALAEWEVRSEEANKALRKIPFFVNLEKLARAKSRARARRAMKNFDLEPRTTMTDAEMRGRLLEHFHSLRHSNGGWVPISDTILAPEPVEVQAIGGVCQQLADTGLINWKPLRTGMGLVGGMAQITGKGVAAVESGRSSQIDVRFLNRTIADGSPATAPKAYTRQLVIAAADYLKALGHTGFDRFILEISAPAEVAGRSEGGLLARANSLAKFAIENPDFLTPEGESAAQAIVERAKQLYTDSGGRASNDRETAVFLAQASRAGLALDQEVSALTANNSQWKSSPLSPATSPLAPGGTGLSGASHQRLPETAQSSKKVFLVHGRDDAAKNEVALFLRAIGLEPIILHLRPNGGRHLLTKFTEESEGAGFAVVLMTPDDEGGLNGGGDRRFRARQNVVFELGFFIGKLGPASVAALIKGEVEKPSDFDGIGYIIFDSGGRWKTDLARELHYAKVPFDPAKALSA